MTNFNDGLDERYHSSSGLKYDLVAVQRILADGDQEALKAFKIGTKDVSSFFVLPTALFGREKEYEKIVKIIDVVARRQHTISPRGWNAVYNFSTSSSNSDDRREPNEMEEGGSSDTSSQQAKRSRSDSGAQSGPTFLGDAQNIQQDSRETVDTTTTMDTDNTDAVTTTNSADGALQPSAVQGMISRRRPNHVSRKKGYTELITIIGTAGMGKSSLIQRVQGEIRRQGYFGNAKFDNVCPQPLYVKAPLTRLLDEKGTI